MMTNLKFYKAHIKISVVNETMKNLAFMLHGQNSILIIYERMTLMSAKSQYIIFLNLVPLNTFYQARKKVTSGISNSSYEFRWIAPHVSGSKNSKQALDKRLATSSAPYNAFGESVGFSKTHHLTH